MLVISDWRLEVSKEADLLSSASNDYPCVITQAGVAFLFELLFSFFSIPLA